MRQKERKEKKRKEANIRTQARKQRSNEQQLAKLDKHKWVAKKERARLNK